MPTTGKPAASVLDWFWSIVYQILGLGALILLWWGAAAGFWPLFIVFVLVLFPILRLAGGHFSRLSGVYNYHSEFAFTWQPRPGELEVHLGGSYDYARLWRVSGGRARAKRVLMASALETLAFLAREARDGQLPPETRITMATYFLDERTMARFGFKAEKVTDSDKAMFALSIVDVWILHWMLTGKRAPPPLMSLVRCATTAAELAAHAEGLAALAARIDPRTRRAEVGGAAATPLNE